MIRQKGQELDRVVMHSRKAFETYSEDLKRVLEDHGVQDRLRMMTAHCQPLNTLNVNEVGFWDDSVTGLR
jgi:hypothetical protein